MTKFTSEICVVAAAAVAVAVSMQLFSSTAATAANCFQQTGCSQCCPACDHCCKLDAKMGEEEKSCFEVEKEVVCIPRVVFPWQRKSAGSCFNRGCDSCDGTGCSACVHNGAKTREVKKLSSRKYKCPKCEYTWSAEKRPHSPCGGECCDVMIGSEIPSVPADVQTLPLQQTGADSQANGSAGNASDYSNDSSDGLEPIEVEH